MESAPGEGRGFGTWRPGRREVLGVLGLIAAGAGVGRIISRRQPRTDLATRARPIMGTIVEIRVPASGPVDESALDAAFTEFSRVERVFSPHKAGGGPTNAGEQREVEHLLALGRRVQGETDGAVDLRMRDWVDLWGWEAEPRRPTSEQLEATRNARRGRPDRGSLQEYAFGAVAKGYAVDRALAILRSRGTDRALVNAGGEVAVLGRDWAVGVQQPRDPGALLDRVRLDEGRAIATSGDYENFFMADGRRWHHILVPATGLPAMECRSVSVVAPSCAEADIWATALFVMGPAAALETAARRRELEVLVVDAAGGLAHSAGWKALRLTGRS